MNNQERIKLITTRLKSLNPSILNIFDESDQHIGHSGAQSGAGHFALEIAAHTLQGKTRVQQHQIIYQLLNDLIPREIHALKITVRE